MRVYIIITYCILGFTQSCKVQVSLNNGPIFNASQEVVIQEGGHISIGCDYCSYNNYLKFLIKTNLSDYSQPEILFHENYTTNIDTSHSFQCCQNDGVWNCSLSTIINVTKDSSNPCECNGSQPLPVTETATYTETVTSITINDVTMTKFLTTDSVISITKSALGITVYSSISDIVMTSSLSAAPTLTVTVISSTYTATKTTNLETTNKTLIFTTSTYIVTEMTNLETINKALIITTSAAGGVCLILFLTIIFFCSYFALKRRKQMSIAQIQAEPQYCEVLELEERVKVSECQAYGKLDKERVKVSECEAYGKLDQLRITRNTS